MTTQRISPEVGAGPTRPDAEEGGPALPDRPGLDLAAQTEQWSSAGPRTPRLAGRGLPLVATALVVVSLLALPAGATGLRVVDHVANVASVVAVVLCGAAARATVGRTSLSWSCFTVATGSWLVADLLWTLDEQWVDQVLVADLADVFYLGGILPCLAGILVVPVGRWEPGARVRLVLDVLVLSTAGVLIADVTVLGRAVPASPTAGDLVVLAYPVADLLVMSLALTLGRRRDGRPRTDLLLLAAAFLAWAVTDLEYARVTLTGADYFSSAVGVGYVVAPLLLALAARTALRPGATVAPGAVVRHAGSRLLAPLPEILVLAAGLAALVRGPSAWHEWALIVLGASLAAVRQVVMALDGHELRTHLEDRVAARTDALRHQADQHRQILGSVADGILGVGQDGRVVFVNTAAERLLGRQAAALLGRSVSELLEDADGTACPLDPGAAGGAPVALHERRVRAAGSTLPVEVTVTPMVGRGSEGGAVVCFRDLTERHRIEEIKRHFVSSVSHELRTPLAAIRGSLEMLADGDAGALPAPATDLVDVAARGTQRLSRLVDDILDVEGLASGHFEVLPRPASVRDVVLDSVVALTPLADRAGVRLEVEALDGHALCDPDRVEQALTNLVGNALKFTPRGRAVRLRSERQGDEVQVTVTDEGRGIPADELARVFDRFHQVPSREVNEHGGTGLGLAITRSIVQRHGGRVWATSVVGRGSTFCFTLPACEDPHVPGDLPGDLPGRGLPETR